MKCPRCSEDNGTRNLEVNSCSYCGFVIGVYSRFNTKLDVLPENVGKMAQQTFGSRYRAKSRRLTRYSARDKFPKKHAVIQKLLMSNRGTAYSKDEIKGLLVALFGNYKGLSRVLNMMKWDKMIRERAIQGQLYYNAY